MTYTIVFGKYMIKTLICKLNKDAKYTT